MNTTLFIVDENLPQHLAYWIRDKGNLATHVDLEGLQSAADPEIWAWAKSHNAIIVSKDRDLFNRLEIGKPPRLIWVRWGNTRKKELIRKFDALWDEIVSAFDGGEWLVELMDSSSI